jgi:diacylglycerol kinase (ATP)
MTNFTPSQTLVIHNPKSGRPKGQKEAHELLHHLSQMGYQIVTTEGSEHARQLGGDLYEQGLNSVICVGGDGTLWQVIEKLHPIVSIGFFPTGTVNLLAKNLAIPNTVDHWMEMLKTGTLQQVHWGLANDRPFINVGSVGFDAQVVARTSTQLKKVIHEGAYGFQALWEFPKYHIPSYSVLLDGQYINEEIFGIIVGKGPYYAGNYPILQKADLRTPNFFVALLLGNKKRNLLEFGLQLIQDKCSEMKNIRFYSALSITINSSPPSYVEVDGEPFGITPVNFSIDPLPRKVLIPHFL